MRSADVRRAPNVQYHRILVRLQDGGLVGLDWYKWQDCTKRLPPKAPVLLVVHGITGVLNDIPSSADLISVLSDDAVTKAK